MNKLYRLIPEVWLNGSELGGASFASPQLHYGKVPQQKEIVEFTDFNMAWNDSLLFCRKDITFFEKERIIIGEIDWCEKLYVRESKFKSYKAQFNAEIYGNDLFSLQELARQLPATDFIKWCKDSGLTCNFPVKISV